MLTNLKKRRVRVPLTLQLQILLVVVLMIPFITVGILGYSSLSNKLEQADKERIAGNSHSSLQLLKTLDNLLGVTQSNSYWVDHWLAVDAGDAAWIEENVLVATDVVDQLHFVLTADTSGKVLAQVGDIPEFTGSIADDAIMEKYRQGEDFSGLVQTSEGIAVIAAARITDEAAEYPSNGVLIFGRLLDGQALVKLKDILQSDIALMTSDGELISSDESLDAALLSTYINEAMQNSEFEVFRSYEQDKMKRIEYMKPLHDLSGKAIGILYVGSPSKASSEVSSMLKTVGLTGLIVLGVILLLFTAVVQLRVIRPLGRFDQLLESIAEGKLAVKAPDHYVNRGDEIGTMAASFNLVSTNLRALLGKISDTAKHVAATAEQLSASSTQTTKSVSQMAEAINAVSEESQVQLERTRNMADVMEEVSGGMEQLGEHSLSIADSSRHAAEQAEQGNQAVSKVVHQMEVISTAVHHSADTVKELSERSQEIGEIVDLITQVANQTNLLALNAAIEAARAGEQGRGFAVVAGEVRKLSEQTEEFAGRITSLIQRIQDEARRAAEAMDTGTMEAAEGLTLAGKAGEAFQMIDDSVREVSRRIAQANEVVKQISDSTRHAMVAVDETSRFAVNSSDKSASAATITQEQIAAMEEISASSDWLNQIAQTLQHEIEKFRL